MVALPRLVFIDVETTGGSAQRDRLTEVGWVEANGVQVRRGQHLVNPGVRVPPFIERLTGITQAMVDEAPAFDALAPALSALLDGAVMVAHNARFDYGFLRQAMQRAGLPMRCRVLCTVKLSRALYPEHKAHGLDALIARHGLQPMGRHRALADADLLWQFWQRMQKAWGQDTLQRTVAQLLRHDNWPSHLDPALLEALPDGPGVYMFFGDNDVPLYVGKSKHIRRRVRSHFAADHRSGKSMRLSLQVRDIRWEETAGEIQALMREAQLVKQWQPAHNQRLRRNRGMTLWHVPPELSAPLQLGRAETWRGSDAGEAYGPFRSARQAKAMLEQAADEHGLCKVVLGLESAPKGRACFARQLGRCRGACVGVESLALHRARLLEVLVRQRLQRWPYGGPVALAEGEGEGRVWHVIDAWRHVGTWSEAQMATTQDAPTDWPEAGCDTATPMDWDLYPILRRALKVLPQRQLTRVTA